MKLKRTARAFLLPLLALLAGCGGGNSDNSGVPTIVINTPANLATNLSGTVQIDVSASDDVGVSSVEFQVDGKSVLTATGRPPYQLNIDTGNYASGQHVIRARASDAVGNVSDWAVATVRFGGTVGVPAGFIKDEAWASGLVTATAMAQAPDGRLFVAEQGGSLRIVRSNGTQPTLPFLQLAVDSTGERGLIGVALDPNFVSNGYVYVHYTTSSAPIHNRISRFTADPANPELALSGSEVPLVDLPTLSAATNHNGGALHFGADGKLYVGVGDNADSSKSTNLDDPFGKLLRFNDTGTPVVDNPFFATRTGLAQAIWAYGLRNPFSFAVQPGTGRIHINDVGENTWEEINLGAAGANYGWPASEGPGGVTAGMTGPAFAYKHTSVVPLGSGPGGFFLGQSIAGGAFYPASGASAVFPAEFRGNYFFADFVSRFIAVLDLANGNAAYAFAGLSGNPVDMLVGVDGALYVLTRTAITQIRSL